MRTLLFPCQNTFYGFRILVDLNSYQKIIIINFIFLNTKCLLLNKIHIGVLKFWYEFEISELKHLLNSKHWLQHICYYDLIIFITYRTYEQIFDLVDIEICRLLCLQMVGDNEIFHRFARLYRHLVIFRLCKTFHDHSNLPIAFISYKFDFIKICLQVNSNQQALKSNWICPLAASYFIPDL